MTTLTTALPVTFPTPAAPEYRIPVGEQRVLLTGISWQTYEALLREEDSRASRFTYDRGLLEIVSPLIAHEERNWLLETLCVVLLEEWEIDFRCLQHTTFRRSDVDRGTEPDSCFYIQNVEQIEGKEQINLVGGDPAPDLVIEVDITSPSVAKLPLYAAFGVPEVWRANAESVVILVREGDHYVESAASAAFPKLTREKLNELYVQGGELKRLQWLRSVRAWARAEAGTGE